jgi:hypothetical protein
VARESELGSGPLTGGGDGENCVRARICEVHN